MGLFEGNPGDESVRVPQVAASFILAFPIGADPQTAAGRFTSMRRKRADDLRYNALR
jgi:hypothetical protein